jgi:hypothetical protein
MLNIFIIQIFPLPPLKYVYASYIEKNVVSGRALLFLNCENFLKASKHGRGQSEFYAVVEGFGGERNE